MPRLLLSDEWWSKLRVIMNEQGIYDKFDLRKTVEGILYRLRTGCPWRDLPSFLGLWNSIYQQFNRWSAKGKLMAIFKALVIDPDLEWEFIDGSIVKAHQHSAGAVGNDDQAIGKSVAGNTTKIHMVAESNGMPIEFEITGGQVHDCKIAPELIALLPHSDYKIADKAYDNKEIRQQIHEQNSTPVIPKKSNSIIWNNNMDWGLYKHRHLIENLFARLKHFRAIATRYDKLKRNYKSMLALACSYLWLPL